MIRLLLVLLVGIAGFAQVGCSPKGGDLTDTVTESDIAEYERLLAESENTSNED